VAETTLVSFRVPNDLWERICANAEKAGRTRTAEMIARLERGEKLVKPEWDKSEKNKSVPVEPKRLLSNKQKLADRAKQEEKDLIAALEPCRHETVNISPTTGVFCSRCGVKLG